MTLMNVIIIEANLSHYLDAFLTNITDKAKKFFEIFNILSLDPIAREDIEKEANSIPDFIAIPLCQEAMKLMKSQEIPKNEEDLLKQFRTVSRIALREGI